MFGLFKKEIDWKDLEFIFVAAAVAVYKKFPATMPADSIQERMEEMFKQGNIKLTTSQQKVTADACAEIEFSSELKDLLQKSIKGDGTLSEAGVIGLVERMRRGGISFGDTPTMADIRKNILGDW